MNTELRNSLHSLLTSGKASKAAISAAVGAFTLVPLSQKHAYWEFLQRTIPVYLEKNGGSSTADVEAIIGFVSSTPFSDIKHIIRRDRHVWHICLHVFRHDGQWLILDIMLGGILFQAGGSPDGTIASIGSHNEATASLEAISRDQQKDIYSSDWGTEPDTIVLFNNGRPIDQSMSIAKFSVFSDAIAISDSVRVEQARLSAYFDPEIFKNISKLGRRTFTDYKKYRDRTEFIKTATSIIEGIYIPEIKGVNLIHYLLRDFRQEIVDSGLAPSPQVDPREELRLFCSLDLEKRRWDEQGPGLLALFERAQTITSRLTVYVGGMTGPIFQAEASKLNEQYAAILQSEAEIAESWKARLGDFIDVVLLGGSDLLAKVKAISGSHFLVTPAGTPSIIGVLADLKGVSYCHPDAYDHFGNMLNQIESIKLICRTTAEPSAKPQTGLMQYNWSGTYGLSYSIAPSAFLDEAWPALLEAVQEAEGITKERESGTQPAAERHS